MRISDWSSDVCSSDLIPAQDPALNGHQTRPHLRRRSAATGGIERAAEPGRYPHPPQPRDRAQHPDPVRGDGYRHRVGYGDRDGARSEEHTSELQSLMRISYAVFCLKKKKINK